jgi:LacI family transcriptional regulator
VVTILEVAKRAGVGVGTVSRVLNDSPQVSAATRERVQQVIAELDFRPSHMARRLSLGRTMTIGVLVPFVAHRSAVERIRGVVERLESTPYDLTLFNVQTITQRNELYRSLADRGRVDGLMVVSLPPSDAEVDRFRTRGVPLVLVDTAHERVSHVVVDDHAGGAAATRHLVECGHRRIGFVGDLPDERFGFRAGADRHAGYRAELRAQGIAPDMALERQGPFGHETAKRHAAELLASPDRPTGIVATSDTQALGVLEAAREAGLRVPEELSVVGYDDIEMAAYADLTTVHQPLNETGACGAELLLERLEGSNGPPVVEQLPVTLVVRGTTGPPPPNP